MVGVAGRVMFVRNTGKLCFASLQEGAGTRLQVMLSLAEVGEDALEEWKRLVDLGDHVFVKGRVISSRRGELSVMASEWRMASKALRPLPVLHKDLSEEARVRQRYADLIVRQEARDMVRLRAAVTPLGAGHARRVRLRRGRDADAAAGARRRRGPAVHHAPERLRPGHDPADRARALPQARGGRRRRPRLRDRPDLPQRGRRLHALARVHDAGVLRGLRRPVHRRRPDARHHRQRGRGVRGGATAGRLPRPARSTSPASGAGCRSPTRWPRRSARRSIDETPENAARLRELADAREVNVKPTWGAGEARPRAALEQLVEETLVQPTFVCDYPRVAPPLARAHRSKPGAVEAWDLFIGGVELGGVLLRAGRPGRAARAADRAVPARRRRRPGGDAARRGLPPRARVRRTARWAASASASTGWSCCSPASASGRPSCSRTCVRRRSLAGAATGL